MIPPVPGTNVPGKRPLLLVPYDIGAVSPVKIASAARSLCDVTFLADRSRPHAAAQLATMHDLGEVWDVTGWDERRICARARELAPQGVVTFSEFQQRVTAAIAGTCGLVGHREETVALLVDKLGQRARLAERRVQSTPCVLVRDASDLPAAAEVVGFPAVIKPRSGAGSVDTCRVDNLDAAVAACTAFRRRGELVLEELLVGDPAAAGEHFGDYVSVETVAQGGHLRTVCVTGKLPLAEPFRETGFCVPATVPAALAQDIVGITQAALRALGVTDGITQTEVKLTARGPLIIEVNGRLGGFVDDLLQRAYGFSLARTAIRIALGLPADLPTRTAEQVTFQRFVLAPMDSREVLSVQPLDALWQLPGVERVDVFAAAGQRLDWRDGTLGQLAIVYGTAPSHEELLHLVADIDKVAASVCV